MASPTPAAGPPTATLTWLGAALLVAAAVTLAPIRRAVDGEWVSTLAYTRSLLLWLLPCAVLGWWYRRGGPRPAPVRRAVTTSLVLLVPMGLVLEFFLGNTFFVFPNHDAVLGLGVPSVGGPIPVEEYVFYVSGFLAILLLYVWMDEELLAAYNLADYDGRWRTMGGTKLLGVHRPFALAGVVALGVAWLLYTLLVGDPGLRRGPWYLAYLVVVSVVPTAALFRAVKPFLNGQAFAVTMLLVVGVSLLWEVTLAIPLGWWGYRDAYMVGVRVPAWADLPVEAVLVWFAAGITVVTVYEAVKIWQWTGAPLVGRGTSRAEVALRRALDVEPPA